ncbi:hypothetical protein AFK68_04880 [Hydrocoleum sp. CS-953]|nr:hypothetical protein AFK68_04880 [Hydrocoleum sp. CS-953]
MFDARLVNSDTTDSVSLLNGSIVGAPTEYNHPTNVIGGKSTATLVSQEMTAESGSAQAVTRSVSVSQLLNLMSQHGASTNEQNPSQEIQVSDYYEGGNVDTSRVVISGENTSSPNITLYARPNVNVEGANPANIYYSLACRVTGMNGKNPTFKINFFGFIFCNTNNVFHC